MDPAMLGSFKRCLAKLVAPAREECYELIEVGLQLIRVFQHLSEENVCLGLQQRTIRRYNRWS
jgi:hypothetical protein